MTTTAHAHATFPVPVRSRRLARLSLLAVALAAAALGMWDLIAPMSAGDRLITASDYGLTALGLPYVLALLLAVTALHRMHRGAGGRLGTAGYAVAAAGLAGFLPCVLDSLITGDSEALGPLYMLSMLVSAAGLALFAIASFRARVLPSWAGPLLAVAWLAGGLIGEIVFPGAGLLLAAASVAIAVPLRDR